MTNDSVLRRRRHRRRLYDFFFGGGAASERDEVMLRFSWTVADGGAAENLSDRPQQSLRSLVILSLLLDLGSPALPPTGMMHNRSNITSSVFQTNGL